MKQAILITAYQHFDQLLALIQCFGEDFNIYIHIDKKSNLNPDVRRRIEANTNVKLLQSSFKINWGGINHLLSYLSLAKTALQHQENIYFHLITGQDYPIKKPSVFRELISLAERKDYLENFPIPTPDWQNGGWDRVNYYSFYDWFDAKFSHNIIKKIINLQKTINYKRPLGSNIPPLHGGSTYWSLTRETLAYVLQYTNEQPALLRRLKHTFCPEEFYFQTVIMNSEFDKNVVNDNLRYIDWSKDRARNGTPAVLDDRDFESILSSKALFARKIDPIISQSLKQRITTRIA